MLIWRLKCNVTKCSVKLRVGKRGTDCYNMVGISWFSKEDANLLGTLIKEAYGKAGYEEKFWDDVVNENIDKLDLKVHEIQEDQMFEIDTVSELAKIDSSYMEVLSK